MKDVNQGAAAVALAPSGHPGTFGKDIPIIFSAPMVRALLEGRKTMTRRMLNRLRIGATPESSAYTLTGDGAARALLEAAGFRNIDSNLWTWSAKAFDHQAPATRTHWHARIPYAVGDRLWVRETWCPANSDNGPVLLTRADTGRRYLVDESYPVEYEKFPAGSNAWSVWAADCEAENETHAWRSPIHMPRWASRLTLIVTGVKIERLRDISDADAKAEGVSTWRDGWSRKEAGLAFLRGTEAAEETNYGPVARRLFYLLWSSLHGDKSWAENPFVVAITFRVIKANIDAPEARIAA
jgi:hypothetical protein